MQTNYLYICFDIVKEVIVSSITSVHQDLQLLETYLLSQQIRSMSKRSHVKLSFLVVCLKFVYYIKKRLRLSAISSFNGPLNGELNCFLHKCLPRHDLCHYQSFVCIMNLSNLRLIRRICTGKRSHYFSQCSWLYWQHKSTIIFDLLTYRWNHLQNLACSNELLHANKLVFTLWYKESFNRTYRQGLDRTFEEQFFHALFISKLQLREEMQ